MPPQQLPGLLTPQPPSCDALPPAGPAEPGGPCGPVGPVGPVGPGGPVTELPLDPV